MKHLQVLGELRVNETVTGFREERYRQTDKAHATRQKRTVTRYTYITAAIDHVRIEKFRADWKRVVLSGETRDIVKNGVWQVPPEQRFKGWERLEGIKEQTWS